MDLVQEPTPAPNNSVTLRKKDKSFLPRIFLGMWFHLPTSKPFRNTSVKSWPKESIFLLGEWLNGSPCLPSFQKQGVLLSLDLLGNSPMSSPQLSLSHQAVAFG